jgi:membrane-associated phospholipid phosphatase
MVVLIAFSTLFLQYHYVVDLLAGVAIALVADRVAAGERCPSDGNPA